MKKISLLVGCCLLGIYGQAQASSLVEQVPIASLTDFGDTGLIQMPSARMAPAGEFSASVNHVYPYSYLNLSLQPFSWLQFTGRYVNIQGVRYGAESLSGDQDYKDKSIDARVRLLSEGYYNPEVSLGARDLGGTGLFSAEYLVASKRVYDFDFTLGMGWGYLGQRDNVKNPFTWASSSYETRTNDVGNGGTIDTGAMFHGPAALFGGIEYQTPWQPLRLKIEYDGNNYKNDFAPNIDAASPINYGAELQLSKYFGLRLGYERGNTWMLGLTMRTNFNEIIPHSHLDEAPAEVKPSKVKSMDEVDWQKLSQDVSKNAGYQQPSFYREGDKVTLRGTQRKYRDAKVGEDRAARLMANALPDTVTGYQIVDEQKRLPLTQTNIPAKPFKQAKAYEISEQQLDDRVTNSSPPHQPGELMYQGSQGDLGYSIDPAFNQSIGGPDGFILYQLGLVPGARYWFTDHLQVYGSAYINLFDNMDKFTYTAPSNLPRVRTYIAEYLNQSTVRLNNLQLTHFDRFGENWYSQVYGGYLEMMYAGAGGQLLYRPLDKRWAVGIQTDAVKQRSYENQLGMRDYDTITGHLTGYYQIPYGGLLAKVSVGRYLAKDWGGTIDLSKTFANGIRAGFFATKTDVSAEEYGEGSFTKGFYLSIPFDVMTVRPSTSTADLNWIPLTRDGGQMLQHKYDLYQITSAREFNES
ncbi:YjbH domain-containing protein [Dongshaea marina]|uniref:YjbH domain-containing protein n=1 Tax=Dongshaea marina TaxID=2047966 RepID=UPI000D3E257C|nr:YjbH domain-containing protein [Dongshaea marina]